MSDISSLLNTFLEIPEYSIHEFYRFIQYRLHHSGSIEFPLSFKYIVKTPKSIQTIEYHYRNKRGTEFKKSVNDVYIGDRTYVEFRAIKSNKQIISFDLIETDGEVLVTLYKRGYQHSVTRIKVTAFLSYFRKIKIRRILHSLENE